MVYLDAGDRWEAIEDAPRHDGVRFEIQTTAVEVPSDGKPGSTGMRPPRPPS